MIGIYQIKNIKNNKCYIGLTTDISNRFLFHQRRLMQGTHKNKHLQTSFNKYGIDSFQFNIIEECSEELLSIREKYWISYFRSYDRKYGYNKTYGGEFGRLSDEIVKGTSDKLRGRTLPDNMKKQISKTLTGKKQSIISIQNRVKSLRKLDDETEALIIDLYINYGYTRKQIENKLNIKPTLIQSVIKRSGLFKYKEVD